MHSQRSRKPSAKPQEVAPASAHFPPLKSLSRGHSHFGEGPCAEPVGRLPSSSGPRLRLRKAPTRASLRSGARVAQPGGHPGPFRAAGAEAASAPLISFPLPGSLQAAFGPSSATSPGTVTLGRLRMVCLESFLWAESGRPPGSPRPRRPRGWGGGGGSKNSSRSPAAEPGGRRLARGEDPRGG